jgi:uncharacterized membrane protein
MWCDATVAPYKGAAQDVLLTICRRESIIFNTLSQNSEVSAINTQSYLAELSRLLGFMSAWDRDAEIEKYRQMLESAPDAEALMAQLGTPTRVAIGIARDYTPTPRPETPAEDESESEEEWEEPETDGDSDAPEEDPPEDDAQAEAPEKEPETGAVFGADTALSPEQLGALTADEAPERSPAQPEAVAEVAQDESAEDESAPEEASRKKRKARPVVTTLYSIVSVIIGLPIAVVLIFLGVPFLMLGGSVIWGVVYAAIYIIRELTMISDIMLVGGVSGMLCALGLVVTWFGLWLSITLGCAWINGVIFRLGSKLCFKKEGDEE